MSTEVGVDDTFSWVGYSLSIFGLMVLGVVLAILRDAQRQRQRH